jgi:hypothetical protein
MMATLVLGTFVSTGLVRSAVGAALCTRTLDLFDYEVIKAQPKLSLAIFDSLATH